MHTAKMVTDKLERVDSRNPSSQGHA